MAAIGTAVAICFDIAVPPGRRATDGRFAPQFPAWRLNSMYSLANSPAHLSDHIQLSSRQLSFGPGRPPDV